MENKIIQNLSRHTEVYNQDISLSHLDLSDMVEISVVTEGRGIHKVLGEAMECEAGDMYIVGTGVPHGYFAISEEEAPTVRILSFSAQDCLSEKHRDHSSDYCYGVFRDNSPVSYAMLNSKAMSEVTHIMAMIDKETNDGKPRSEEAVEAYLCLLLINLSRYINLADTARPLHSKEWATVSSAMRAVLENCSDSSLTLESIAASLYISKSRLSRLFQKEIGESFLDYLRNVRISRACSLLRNTALTNEEIVRMCGLKDIPSFYRVFKAAMGQTPYQYRMAQGGYSKLSKEAATENILSDISDNMQLGKSKNVLSLVEMAIKEGLTASEILNQGLLKGMNIVGTKFKNNEVYVPEVLLAARSMNEAIKMLKSHFTEDTLIPVGKVCIGTVQGDLHDIGKNLVKLMMESKGLEVIDLGTDVSPEAFVQTAVNENCSVICCSALLTTTMGVMADVVKCAENTGIRDKVKILIGGAPVTEEFCREIGADMYTDNATGAAEAAVKFCLEAKNKQ